MTPEKQRAADYEAVIRRLLKEFSATEWCREEDREAIQAARNVILKHTGERPQ